MKTNLKYIVFFIGLVATCGNIFAQTKSNKAQNCDSVVSYIATLVEELDTKVYLQEANNRYKLYPTENIYNFLKLDTKTGKIDQVQWSLDSDNEGSVSINSEDLSWSPIPSLFELYPTQNMYQFVLLDKSNGRTWHVQWGMENNKRWIRRIY